MTTFLAWAAQPEMDERKLMGIKGLTIIGACVLVAGQCVWVLHAPLHSQRCQTLCVLGVTRESSAADKQRDTPARH